MSSLSGEQKEQISVHLGAARTQLEMAQALGYEADDARETLDDDIKRLKKQINAGEDTGGLFHSIKRQFSSLQELLTT